MASLDGTSKAAPFVQSPSNEFRAEISPDGHWIAYVSNESGRDEVILESFPQPGQRKRISTEGGNFPAWRPDGHELYYLEPSAAQKSKLMAVRVDASSAAFVALRPELLFETPPLGNNPRRGQFAAFGAGDRFLMNVLVEDTKPRAITVILNWPALLK
jgi:eukaryotic-like serine/threonine-protein kinase